MLDRQRTQRQDVIEGWCTEQLRERTVGIAGDGPLAQHVAAYLAGMGVGQIYLVGNRRAHERTSQDFLGVIGPGQEEVHRIAEELRRINPETEVMSDCRPPLDAGTEKQHLGLCDIVADVSDKMDWKEITKDVARKSDHIEFYISASADATRAGYYVEDVSTQTRRAHRHLGTPVGGPDGGHESRVFNMLKGGGAGEKSHSPSGHGPVYAEGMQGSVPSGVIGAFCVDLVRYALMPLEQQGECMWRRDEEGGMLTAQGECEGMSYEKPVVQKRKPLQQKCMQYSLYEATKTATVQGAGVVSSSAPSFEGEKALVIGAGGIGTYVALHLALCGVGELHVADPDTVDMSNLNRQILFTQSDAEQSRNKADALCDSLSKIKPGIDYRPIGDAFTFDSRRAVADEGYDIVYSCVDDPRASREISDLMVSLERPIPMVYGNISAFRGSLGVYLPGQTACPACQNEHYVQNIARIREREQERPNSCANIGESNVVVPNALIGALMVGEGYLLLRSPEDAILNQRMRFNGHKFSYGLSIHSVDPCSCRDAADPCKCQYLMEGI